MSLYAVLDSGVIVGRRQIDDWANYPAHKKAARDERGDGGPTLRPITFIGTGPIESIEIQIDQVIVTRADPPPPPPQTPGEIINAHFPQSGTGRVLFEALFDIANRLQALEGKQAITREQLKTWLQSKLP